MNGIAKWLEQHQLPCLYKKLAGIDCPGCGMQRSFFHLINGDFITSLKLYPPLIPIILTLVFLCFHLKFDFKSGAKILIYSFSFSALLIVANYLVKLVY